MIYNNEYIKHSFVNKTIKYPDQYSPKNYGLSDFEYDGKMLHKILTYGNEWVLGDNSGIANIYLHLVGTTTGGAGTNGYALGVVDSSGVISQLTLLNGGTGYINGETVDLYQDGIWHGGTATITAPAGTITNITLVSGGTTYTMNGYIPESNTSNLSALGSSTYLSGSSEINEWLDRSIGILQDTYYHAFLTNDNYGNKWAISFGSQDLSNPALDGGYSYLLTSGSSIWSQQKSGLTADSLICGYYLQSSDRLFAGSLGEGIFYKSTPGNSSVHTFIQVNDGLSDADPAIDKKNKTIRSIVSDSNDIIYIGTDNGIFYSNNGGDSWNKLILNYPPVSTRILALDIIISNSQEVLLIGSEAGPLYKYDITNSVPLSSENIGGTSQTIHHISHFETLDGTIRICVGTQGNYLYISQDVHIIGTSGSLTWYNLGTTNGFTSIIESIRQIVYIQGATAADDILYVATWGDGVYRNKTDLSVSADILFERINVGNLLDTPYIKYILYTQSSNQLLVATFGSGKIYELNESGIQFQEFDIPLVISGKELYRGLNISDIVNLYDVNKYTINKNDFFYEEIFENDMFKIGLSYSDIDIWERNDSTAVLTRYTRKMTKLITIRKTSWYYKNSLEIGFDKYIPKIDMFRFLELPTSVSSYLVDKEYVNSNCYLDENNDIHIHLFTKDSSNIYALDIKYDLYDLEYALFLDTGLKPVGIKSITINNGGSGFTQGEVITSYTTDGSVPSGAFGFTGVIETVSGGAITSIRITNPGYGFDETVTGTITSINGTAVNIEISEYTPSWYQIFGNDQPKGIVGTSLLYPNTYPSEFFISPDIVYSNVLPISGGIDTVNIRDIDFQINSIMDTGTFTNNSKNITNVPPLTMAKIKIGYPLAVVNESLSSDFVSYVTGIDLINNIITINDVWLYTTGTQTFTISDISYFVLANNKFYLLNMNKINGSYLTIFKEIVTEYGNYYDGLYVQPMSIVKDMTYNSNIFLKTGTDNEHYMNVKFMSSDTIPAQGNYTEVRGKYLLHQVDFYSFKNLQYVPIYRYDLYKNYVNKTYSGGQYVGNTQEFGLILNDYIDGNNSSNDTYKFGFIDYTNDSNLINTKSFKFKCVNLKDNDVTKYLKNIMYLILNQEYRKYNSNYDLYDYPIYVSLRLNSFNKSVYLTVNNDQYKLTGTSKLYELGFNDFDVESLDDFEIKLWNDNTHMEIFPDSSESLNLTAGTINIYMKKQSVNESTL